MASPPDETLWQRLLRVVGEEGLLRDEEQLEPYAGDYTEEQDRAPALVVFPRSTEQVQRVVRAVAAARATLTVRVAGSNVGGLAIPPEGGVVLDLSRMNRIHEVNEQDMVAVIEPGVTWEQLKAHLAERKIPLRMGYPLSPPDTSIIANCLLDGLGNLSMRHGAMADWIGGLEVVLPGGELLRSGAAALSDVWFGRGPLPDLSGLFVSTQGTTGVVTRMGFQLWPTPPHRQRLFVLYYERDHAFAAMRALARTGGCDDVGGLSWPTGKMLFGVERPAERDPGEPEFFLYLDLSGWTEEELRLRRRLLDLALEQLRAEGARFEAPLTIETLVRLNPAFDKFAHFPTRLDFLLDHPGGGLSWVGTYGPMSRFEAYAERGCEILARHAFPPILVSRPMKGGHFGVMRFIATFDRREPEQRRAVRALNLELAEAGLELGFIPYKTPPWAVKQLQDRLDPGFARLLRRVRRLLDPTSMMAPHCWPLAPPGEE